MEPPEQPVTKGDLAYRLVRDQVLSGRLAAGAVIRQRDLARDLGISTTPLREAMRRLESEGLVELGAHRDARVSALRPEEARDLLELRRALDPFAARLAAQRRSSTDLAAIRSAHDRLVPLAGNPTLEALVAHRAFHVAIYTASHNDLLVQTLDSLWDRADRYRRLVLATGRDEADRDRAAREHAELVELVVAGDDEGVAQVMRAHVESSLGAAALARLREGR